MTARSSPRGRGRWGRSDGTCSFFSRIPFIRDPQPAANTVNKDSFTTSIPSRLSKIHEKKTIMKGDSQQIHCQDVNPLTPRDAIKHHFTSLKTDPIFLQPRVVERNFHETGLLIHGNFLLFFTHFKSSSSTTSRELRQQFATCSG